MKLKLSLVATLLFAINFTTAQETEAPKFGKGLFNLVGKDSSWTMKIGLRAQFLATSTWADGETNEANFLIRRSRLKFDGYAYSPKLKYKIELGLSNRDISGASQFTSNTPRYILDAVLMWNFAPNLEFWFGQTKLPGNRERVISSSNLQMVDRSMLNSEYTIDPNLLRGTLRLILPHRHALPAQRGGAQRADRVIGDVVGDFHQREAFLDLDRADLARADSGLVRDRADDVRRAQSRVAACANVHPHHSHRAG